MKHTNESPNPEVPPPADTTDLPQGWAHGKLEDWIYIAGRIGWRGLKAEEYTQEGPLFLSVYDLNDGQVDLSHSYHISEERYNESPEIQLRNDDVLLVKDGAGIGKIGMVEGLNRKATVNSSLLVIRSSEVFEPRFLFYFLQGPKMQEVVKKRITGSATPHLFQRDIKKFDLFIPPLKEQQRIVAKVEELFTRLDAGVKSLQTVKVQLKRYRQSVLKSAFQGKLTEQWRRTHRDELEPASELLARIQQERRKRWEEENRATAKEPAKYKYEEEPERLDVAQIPLLPNGWIWTNFNVLVIDARYGTSQKCTAKTIGVPVLRIPNIVNGILDTKDLKYSKFTEDEVRRLRVRPGDLLVIRTNGSLGIVGRSAIVSNTRNIFLFASYLIRLRPVISEFLPAYLNLILASPMCCSIHYDVSRRSLKYTSAGYR